VGHGADLTTGLLSITLIALAGFSAVMAALSLSLSLAGHRRNVFEILRMTGLPVFVKELPGKC